MTFSPRDRDRVGLTFLHHPARHLAADVADFPLQVADPGLARVIADDSGDRIVAEADVLLIQSGLFALLLHQEVLGDFELLRLRVAVQPQHFHAVLQTQAGMVCSTFAVAMKNTCDKSYSTSR